MRKRIKNMALAVASAHASQDADLSAQVFRAFWNVDPIVHVVLDASHLPFDVVAVFAAGDVAALRPLRARLIDEAMSDYEIETAVAVAESVGAQNWLDAYVEGAIERPEPSAVARALLVAGLRSPNDQSRDLLARDWSVGFLGGVANAARDAYRDGERSLHWLAAWREAKTSLDLWATAQMMEGVADRRTMVAVDKMTFGEHPLSTYYGEMLERFRKAAEARSKAREQKLFGQKKPTSDLRALLPRSNRDGEQAAP